MGWAGIKNGELMSLAEQEFDVFVTVDRNLSYQQHLPKYNVILIVLRAISNRVQDLVPFADKILQNMADLSAGEANIFTLE